MAFINCGNNAGSWHSFWEMPTGHDCVRFRGKTGKSSAKGQNDAIDPLQKWGRGSATPYAEHRSNMKVINISAKKSEP